MTYQTIDQAVNGLAALESRYRALNDRARSS
jgi:hypothetical protein